MDDFTTSLTAAMNRAMESVLDEIAKDGLVVLKDLLTREGFTKSEFLRDFDVYAHVLDGEITFEIVLSVDSVVPGDDEAKKAMQQQASAALDDAARTYGLSLRSPRRVIGQRDARRPAADGRRDARRPARDVRKTSKDRLVGHEVSNRAPRNVVIPKGGAPRSATVNSEGKLSVVFQRSLRESGSSLRLSKNKFDGIIGRFVDRLQDVIVEKFAPELAHMIEDRI